MRTTPSRTRAIIVAVLSALEFGACASAQPRPGAPPQAAPAPKGDEPRADTDPMISELIEAHNRERAKAGLGPLRPNAQLMLAAQRHARDMAEHEKMSHEGSDGSQPKDRIEKTGYRHQAIAENVAMGQQAVEEVMQSWMNSPHHKENILGDFTEIGAAVAKGPDGRPYWAATFGRPWPKLDPAEASARLVEAFNRERAKAELPPLTSHPQLEAAAREQAEAMARQGRLDAKADDGSDPFRRLQQAGYRFLRAAMGVASGQPTPEDLARSWIEDRAQKKNILGEFSQIGVGYATAEDGIPYWCVIFAQPAGR